MEILTRRVGESLIIGDVAVTVLGVKGNQVRISTSRQKSTISVKKGKKNALTYSFKWAGINN